MYFSEPHILFSVEILHSYFPQLYHYLDLIEVELVRQISTRSDSFFAALANLQELYEDLRKTCDKINHIRYTKELSFK